METDDSAHDLLEEAMTAGPAPVSTEATTVDSGSDLGAESSSDDEESDDNGEIEQVR